MSRKKRNAVTETQKIEENLPKNEEETVETEEISLEEEETESEIAQEAVEVKKVEDTLPITPSPFEAMFKPKPVDELTKLREDVKEKNYQLAQLSDQLVECFTNGQPIRAAAPLAEIPTVDPFTQTSARLSEYLKQNQSPYPRFVAHNLHFMEPKFEGLQKKDTRSLVQCGNTLQRANLKNTTFSTFKLHNTTMNYVNVYSSLFSNFDFLNVNLIASDFNKTHFKDVVFENVDLQRCFFESCVFENCTFIGSNMAFAFFDSDCTFENVKISNCHVEYLTISLQSKDKISFERTHSDKVNWT